MTTFSEREAAFEAGFVHDQDVLFRARARRTKAFAEWAGQLMDKTGLEAIHVPYKGGGQAIQDVLAGHVPMTITSVQAVKGLVEGGKVRALAVTSPERSPAMPDVPTMQEAGVPKADVELRFWFAVFGPKGMPADVKAKLAKAVEKVMSDPKVRERLAKLDIEPMYMPGDALEKKLQSEIVNWTKFIDAKGIKAE